MHGRPEICAEAKGFLSELDGESTPLRPRSRRTTRKSSPRCRLFRQTHRVCNQRVTAARRRFVLASYGPVLASAGCTGVHSGAYLYIENYVETGVPEDRDSEEATVRTMIREEVGRMLTRGGNHRCRGRARARV